MTEPPVPPPAQDEVAEPAPERFPFWNLTDVLLFMGLGLPVFVVAYAVTFAPLLALGVESRALRLLVPQFAGYIGALAPLWLIFRSRYGRSPLEALRLGTSSGTAIMALPTGILAAFAVLALGVLLRTPPIETPMQELLRDPISILVVGVLASTIGPLFEEVFFRGLLQPVLVLRLGVLSGIVVSSLPFALLHGPQYAWSWRHVLLITFAGCLFGWKRYRTGSTGAAALMHAAYNLTLFVGFVVARALEADLPQAV